MLEKIKYQGFTISASQFIEHKDSEGGRFKLLVSDSEFASGYDEEQKKCWAQLAIEASIKGYDDDALIDPDEPDEEGLAFEVNLKIDVFYDIDGDKPIEEEFYESNLWFFENFTSITLKLAFESILERTPMRTIKLPWSVPLVAVEE
ncbi:hypothetical protein HCI75_02890 [Escherichia coli]|jgi:hypothetical protein|uniref:hypothetical protein n=1 Tax=Enterobacteriaceae TaxID=543 RepID=UPI00044594AA|nr:MULTISPECIES: hypothetical protein [Enterobacteriaceae]EGT0019528.1 hypothetical protein [Citrobacter freundii]EGT0456089.1 hypothetical protein [Citrobacter freundii]EJD4606489.1 hypothetical protein [Escherichia coli]EJG2187791.1 hypothetical protein [Citrobacter freundii]EKW9286456.1 hypothetical protein [Citrobacter freundii]